MDIPNPVYEDGTISLDVEVIETKEISSRDDLGMVVINTVTTTQEATLVFKRDVKFIIEKKEEEQINADQIGGIVFRNQR